VSQDAPDIDPAKLYAQADRVLNQLAALTYAVVKSWDQYHVAPQVRAEAGNAVALIMSLRKSVDNCSGGL